MNILYVSSLYPPSIGGAQLQLHCLARAMHEAGESVHVLTYTARNREDWLRLATVRTEPETRYEHEGVPVTRIGLPRSTRMRMLPWAAAYYPFITPSARRLARLTQPHVARLAGKPELIHLTRIGREFIARACLEYARERGIPFILTPNHHPRWRGWRYVEYDRIYRESDALIVYTEAEKETVARDIGVDPARVHVTGVGPLVSEDYDVAAFRREAGVEGPFILFLGQQYKYKGMAAVLDAAPAVWERYPGMRFVFIGPPTNYSRDLFSGVSDPRIVNLGAVSPETKAAALASCEFLCMPSTQESFGGVYIEAWCYRKAVIGGDIPPIACVIDHGENGLLSAQRGDALAAAMLALLDDPERRRVMGEKGWEKVQARYSWARLAQTTRAVYKEVIAAKSRAEEKKQP